MPLFKVGSKLKIMKKKYFKPEIEVHEMQLQCSLLAASNPNEEKEYYPEDENYYDGSLG